MNDMKTIAMPEGDVKKIYEETHRDGELCIKCEHNRIIRERRPWGDTFTVEILRECVVPEINECPGVAKKGNEEL